MFMLRLLIAILVYWNHSLAQQRNCVLNGDHFKFIQHAGLLLGLTIIQSIIWIGEYQTL